MSSVYATEPPTNGKVVLHTTLGDIDIELWTNECPKTCRNFLQLIMEDYYNGLIIHRIIPNLLIQTGDPQGSGQSRTEDIYNGNIDYTKEIHSRLKFNHRGQVAMAEGKGSQFFITLDKADWLGSGNSTGTGTNRQYCIFGKVTGPSIYNLVRISELATDKNDRPLDPPVIQSVEILSSPYDDITIRSTSKRALANLQQTNTKTNTNTVSTNRGSGAGITKKPSTHLLSFANNEDEEYDEEAVATNRRKNSSVKGNATVSSITNTTTSTISTVPIKKSLLGTHVIETIVTNTYPSSSSSSSTNKDTPTDSSSSSTTTVVPGSIIAAATVTTSLSSLGNPSMDSTEEHRKDGRKSEEERIEIERQKRAQEFLQLTEELRSTRRAINLGSSNGSTTTGNISHRQNDERNTATDTLLTPLQAMREKYTQKKRNIGNREAETLAKLAVFQSTLKTVVETTSTTDKISSEKVGTNIPSSSSTNETYHGQVLENTHTVTIQDASWMNNRLKFKHHIDDSYKGFTNNLIGKTSNNLSPSNPDQDNNDDDGLLTIDPRQSTQNPKDTEHYNDRRTTTTTDPSQPQRKRYKEE